VAPPVAAVLGEVLGSDLGAIERALEKLSLYLHGRGDVTIPDIEAVVAYTKVHAIYELPDAVGRGDTARALGLLRRMISQGGGVRSDGFGVRMVSMLFRQFRQIWKVHSLLADGCPPARMAEFAGIPPFRVNDFVRSARLFRRDDLMAALSHLFRADRAMKTSRGDAEHVLQALVLDLCGATAARRRPG